MHGNMEWCFPIIFCVKFKKNKQEAYGMLEDTYGDEGKEQAKDEHRSEALKSACKEENSEEVQD